MTKQQYSYTLNKKSQTVLYTNKVMRGLNFISVLRYKTCVSLFHYDNLGNLFTKTKTELFTIQISNLLFSVEYFYNKFLIFNRNFYNKFNWLEESIKFVFLNIIKKRILNLIGFFTNNFKFNFYISKVLTLNYKRKRFFPLIRDLSGTTFFNTSLGILSKYLQKGKFFTKKKPVFLLVASLIRKMLMYSSLDNLCLIIKRTPMYLQEILSTINNPVSSVYNDPFTKKEVNEFNLKNKFNYRNILFITTKPYGPVKTKNKGRLKRKISKKLTLVCRVSD